MQKNCSPIIKKTLSNSTVIEEAKSPTIDNIFADKLSIFTRSHLLQNASFQVPVNNSYQDMLLVSQVL